MLEFKRNPFHCFKVLITTTDKVRFNQKLDSNIFGFEQWCCIDSNWVFTAFGYRVNQHACVIMLRLQEKLFSRALLYHIPFTHYQHAVGNKFHHT
ncbi:Uncharacterised protein [Vibrio cholerae]|nr:Uncharacterised protein [Vibrio cholerae]